MKRILVCAFLALALPVLAFAAGEEIVSSAHGVPTFIKGDLGFIDPLPEKALAQDDELFRLSAKNYVQDLVLTHFSALGDEDLQIKRVRSDELGTVHVRFDQYLHGLKVVGADLIVHAETATGRVYAVNGNFAPSAGVPTPAEVKGSPAEIPGKLQANGVAGKVHGRPELLYFHSAETGITHVAWKVNVRGIENGNYFDNDVYLDALRYTVVAVDANVHTAKVRRTYNATGSVVTSTTITGLPGVLSCADNQTCGDASATRAHTGAGTVYDYYQSRFGRDSLNGSGMTLTSSVHVGSNWANAAWYNNQMVYGDGDGVDFIDLTNSFDVIAHELTHGVTQFESDLIYEKESGALNEALSDIFGVAADSYRRGGVVDASTWKLGEECFTPGTSGDALRYMDNPTLDGYSRDYYPERLYPGSCTPSGSNDSCGVHGNSGIANLAFKLLVTGGTHPRGKTTNSVPVLGILKAEQIFYRAQTTYLGVSSNFQAARTATVQAATDLYGATDANAVHEAWCAVGVPGCPGGGGGGGALSNGVPKTGLSGSTGNQTFYTIAIPAGSTNLSVVTSGGTGDADLYVRFGSQPTTSTYTCRSWNSGNNETCSFPTPSAGTYHVMMHAYASYSGASLVATWTAPGACGTSSSVTNISGTTNSQTRYTFNVASCATTATIKISGGTGDADLYVRFGSQPTLSTWTCRPYLTGNNETCTFTPPSSGTYHIMLHGYTSYSGVKLDASYQ